MLIWDLNLNSLVKQKSVSPTRLNKYGTLIALEDHLHVLEKITRFHYNKEEKRHG